MEHFSTESLVAEHRRIEALAAQHGQGPGRAHVLGWDLEYTSPAALLAFLDQILFRRMNDFIAGHDRPVILDCGANIGYTVLHYKRQYPGARITAFEPDPQFVPLLRRNLARNGASDVAVVEAAAWIADGRSTWVMEGTDGSRLASTASTGRLVEVATVDLARLLDGPVDLLKMDIEGAEFELLPHLAPRLHQVRNILVECHLAAQQHYQALGRMLAVLTDAGFHVGLNSFGPWRDLTRRCVPEPLHAEQYVLLTGSRTEHPAVSRVPTYAPYSGLGHPMELDSIAREVIRLQQVESENVMLKRTLAGVAGSASSPVFHLTGPFRREEGHCWTCLLPPEMPPGDSSGETDSLAILLENDRVLGPAHALHREIRSTGAGRYSHWRSDLYLSTSDNSDPNTNGRSYTLICPTSAAAACSALEALCARA